MPDSCAELCFFVSAIGTRLNSEGGECPPTKGSRNPIV
jgi:hypothetical protein